MSETEQLHEKLEKEARAGGYIINPNTEDTLMLVEGLLTNTKRYGYPSCPCRIASGKKGEENDIICPCDYRDVDLNDHGACYCALYVTQDWVDKKTERHVVPERRPPKARRDAAAAAAASASSAEPSQTPGLKQKVWRCRVCGYLCARDKPPDRCPVCKVPAERFEPFQGLNAQQGTLPVWRCKVCGYLCAREGPPETCPICKVPRDRFERFG